MTARLTTLWSIGVLAVGLSAKPQAAWAADTSDDLGVRESFNLAWTSAEDWESVPSLTLAVRDGTLILNNTGEPAPVAPLAHAAFDGTADVSLHVKSLTGGQLTAQLEWFDKDDKFIRAVDAVDRITEGDVKCDLKAGDWIPADGPKPAKLRVKMWVGGAGAKAVIDRLVIRAPRRWQTPNVHLVQRFDGRTAFTPDQGMIAEAQDSTITLRLGEGKQRYAGLPFDPMVAFNPEGVVMLDCAALRGGEVGLQAVCFDAAGQYLQSVDLMTGLNQPGLYEVSFKLFESTFPKATTQVRFKLWLAGDKPEARVVGVFYGAPRP